LRTVRSQKQIGLSAGEEERIARLEAEIVSLEEERDRLTAEIPAEWDQVHDTFAELIKAEDTARKGYRRAADESWEGPAEVLETLGGTEAFAALRTELDGVADLIATADGDTAEEALKALEKN